VLGFDADKATAKDAMQKQIEHGLDVDDSEKINL